MDHSFNAKDGSLEIVLKNKFTFQDNKIFAPILEDVAKSIYKTVTIDLKNAEFIDSAALGILLLTRDKCEKSFSKLVIKNPTGQVKQMFDISRFNDLFDIVND